MDAPARRALALLLLFYAILILHGTLWPYNFRFDPAFIRGRIGKVNWIPFSGKGVRETADLVLNVALFVPFGIGAFLLCKKSAAASIAVATASAMVLSGLIEAAQVGLPTRSASVTDVATNTAGGFAGAALAASIRHYVAEAGEEEIRAAFRRNVPFLVLAAYASALIASSAYTLDPVGTLSELRSRVKGFLLSPAIEGPWSGRVGTAVAGGFLSFLAAEWLMTAFSTLRRRAAYLLSFLACAPFLAALEGLQVFFRSRVPLRGDIVAGLAGIVYGLVLHDVSGYRTFRPLFRQPVAPGTVGRFRRPVLFALFRIHYPLLILCVFLSPLDLSWENLHCDTGGLIPLYDHVTHPRIAAIPIVLRAAVLYLPVGAAFALASRGTGPQAPRRAGHRNPSVAASPAVRAAAFAVVIQAVVEVGRAFTASRHPDVTNVLMAALGAWAGACAIRRKPANPDPGA